MSVVIGRGHRCCAANECNCSVKKIFIYKTPPSRSIYGKAWPVSMGLHLMIEWQQEVPLSLISPEFTAPYQSTHSYFQFQDHQTSLTPFPSTGRAQLWKDHLCQAGRRSASHYPFLPPQCHSKENTLLAHRRKRGKCDSRHWNHGGTEHCEYQKSHRFVVLAVVVVPGVGMACIST